MNNLPPFKLRNVDSRMYYLDGIIGLLPVAAAAVILSGTRGVIIMLVSALSAFVTDEIFCLISGRKGFNLLPIVTGLTVCMVCPLSIPIWVAALFAVIAAALSGILKSLGRGNLFSAPALAWLVMLMAAPGVMSTFPTVRIIRELPVFSTPTGFESAETILFQMRTGYLPGYSVFDLISGRASGGFGAVALAAVAVSFIYLILRRNIAWEATASLLVTVLAVTALTKTVAIPVYHMYLLQLSAGSLFFAAVFIVSSGQAAPKTTLMRVIYGAAAGGLIMLLRAAHFDEFAVPFAIFVCSLFFNLVERTFYRKGRFLFRLPHKIRRAGENTHISE